MTRSITAVVDWAKATPTYHGQDWEGWCEGFVADAGGFTNSFSTATLELAHASHLYTPSQVPAGKAPDGWLYHWAYVGDDHVDYGHVAFAVHGGLALMASSYVTQPLHSHLGYIAASAYQGASGHHYLGATPDHGGQYLLGVQHSLPTAPAKRYHTVVKGDTLNSIAAADKTTWQRLYALNVGVVGRDPNAIVPGEKLLLP